MEDSNGSKPFVVTSSLSLKVTTPSFYNQPKKFASVAPPRPKEPNQSQPPTFSSSVANTAVIGRVGEMPPPPPALDDFPPPPPPLDELPAPPPECQTTPPASEAPPPAFPAPPPVADDLPLPAPPEDISFVPSNTCPAPPPPPPPPPPAPPLPEPGTGTTFQRPLETQTSFDRQLDSLTDMLSEMETRRPFNPKMLSQPSSVPAPKPPPTAPKPALSFLPPPELQDRPPPAPWAEELRARTTLRQTGPSSASAPAPAAQPMAKGPAAAPKPTFSTSQHNSNFGPKTSSPATSAGTRGINSVTSSISFPPAPAAPPAPPTSVPKPAPAFTPSKPAPAFTPSKPAPTFSQEKVAPSHPAAPQPKPPSPPISSYSKPMGNPSAPKSPQPTGHGAGAPPTGVPLSMREVEELERLTKDFIKDMDQKGPVITSAPTEVCGKCGEALSRSQPAVRAMDKLFHSHCFCCVTCQRPLQGMQFYDRDGSPECEDCYVNSLAICSRCGERITDRVLKAVGQCFHAHCFRCSACSCTLEGAPFITDDDNNPFCVPDYHRRFSPLCVSCNEPIVPDPGSEETVRVVALEKNFHLKCYRCEDCARPLSIEADADGCYPLDGRILCMKCHTKRAKQAMQ